MTKANAVNVWRAAMLIGPVAAFVLSLIVTASLNSFDDFELVNKPLTFLQALGMLGALCFPCGVFVLARSRLHCALARASQDWPTVSGVVRKSEVKRRITGLPMVLWQLALAYDYRVSATHYEGEDAQFGPKYVSSRPLIDKLAERYPVGSEVAVHYDPNDPSISVLETSDELARQNGWQIAGYFMSPFVISAIVAIRNASL